MFNTLSVVETDYLTYAFYMLLLSEKINLKNKQFL